MTTENSIGFVKGLHHYPVKSLTGEKLDSAEVLFPGFKYDRHWMLVDEQGRFLSQRTLPKMALISSRITKRGLMLNIPGYAEIPVQEPSRVNDGSMWRKVSIWKDNINALHLDENVDGQLSEFLQKTCHLVVMSKENQRIISDPAASGIVSFADAFPYLLIGTQSLVHLNGKLDYSVKMENFRPNIIVDTTVAHEEDSWHEIQIGEIKFRNVKRCSRCILTTVDPDSGIRSTNKEPLKTLITYRQIASGAVNFGCNLIALNEGIINQGDKLQILSYKAD